MNMKLLHWDPQMRFRRPVLIAAFEGWNDAGDAASAAVAYFARVWGAVAFATFDPEELFDYTATRPQVLLERGRTRRLEWPAIQLSRAELVGQARDVILLTGPEPQLHWRQFVSELEEFARTAGIELAVMLGALLADVAHTRPVKVTGSATTPELARSAGLEPSNYEGPTGILGVIADAFERSGIPTASLWASVPHYVSQSPSPKATLALVERTSQLLHASVDLVELQVAAAAYERQVNELVAADEDALAYVSRLEAQDDSDESEEWDTTSAEHLAAEVERYLREHRRD
jgi:hypothetical protein